MPNGKLIAICIACEADAPMRQITQVVAEKDRGLVGDRYYKTRGSYNRGTPGKRQVTLMNALFFPGSGFTYADTRRNLFVDGVELMDLIGKEFHIGEAMFRGVKYCDPCNRPNKMAGIDKSFRDTFFDRGGLIADVITTGTIRVGDTVKPPKKDY